MWLFMIAISGTGTQINSPVTISRQRSVHRLLSLSVRNYLFSLPPLSKPLFQILPNPLLNPTQLRTEQNRHAWPKKSLLQFRKFRKLFTEIVQLKIIELHQLNFKQNTITLFIEQGYLLIGYQKTASRNEKYTLARITPPLVIFL